MRHRDYGCAARVRKSRSRSQSAGFQFGGSRRRDSRSRRCRGQRRTAWTCGKPIFKNQRIAILPLIGARRLEILHKANGEAQSSRHRSICTSIHRRAGIDIDRCKRFGMALLTGGRMVCCARAGDPAPPLGLEVSVESGLSGECLCTGLPALCEDTATDPRVDSELCRAIGIGSFIATPILSDCYAIGLLEVFSPQAGKFSKAEAEILEHLAKLVSGANTGDPHSDTV